MSKAANSSVPHAAAFLFAGVVVDTETAKNICQGKQRFIAMPFQSRVLSKQTDFCLLSKDVIKCDFFSGGTGNASHIKLTAVITFVSNRRLTHEKLVALGQTDDGYGLPSTTSAVTKLKKNFSLMRTRRPFLFGRLL